MAIIIESRSEGFRRAGTAHPARPVEYPDDRFSSEELAVLKAEPMLIVKEEPKGKKGEEPQGQDVDEPKAVEKAAKKKKRK